jgi:hypothetical protein
MSEDKFPAPDCDTPEKCSFMVTGSSTTLLATSGTIDRQGRYTAPTHNPNTTRTDYACIQCGKTFSVTT